MIYISKVHVFKELNIKQHTNLQTLMIILGSWFLALLILNKRGFVGCISLNGVYKEFNFVYLLLDFFISCHIQTTN